MVKPAKAALADFADAGIALDSAYKALIESIEQAHADLTPTSETGEAAAMVGLDDAVKAFDSLLAEIRQR